VREVRGDEDRLVKRMIATNKGEAAAGFARLTDDPPLHFLLVITADQDGATELTSSLDGQGAEIDADPADETEMADIAEPEPEPEPDKDNVVAMAEAERADEHPTNMDEAAPAPQSAMVAEPEPSDGPVRFVWRTDAEGRFNAIGEEFVAAVGPRSAGVLGEAFTSAAERLGLDPTGEIAGLLARRDTWSGRAVLWPIAGTDRMVPVDLAALPVYGRGRVFEGFRGFGIARMGDAVTDPEARGMALAAAPTGDDRTAGDEPDEMPAANAHAGEPALPRLSNAEKNALREIGERLKRDTEPVEVVAAPDAMPHDVVVTAEDAIPPAPIQLQPDPVDEVPVLKEEGSAPHAEDDAEQDEGGEVEAPSLPEADEAGQPPLPSEPAMPPAKAPSLLSVMAEEDGDPAEAADEAAAQDSTAEMPKYEPDQAELFSGQATENDTDNAGLETEQPSPGAPSLAQDNRPVPAPAGTFLPSAFAQNENVDTSVLSRLPLPILIHAGDVLHYANREFLRLTGYRDLDGFAAAGGIDAMFAEPYLEAETEYRPERKLRLRTAQGKEFPVDAHLQRIPWRGGQALLLALQHAPGEDHAQVVAGPPHREPDRAALEEHIAEMRAIIDTATDGVVIIDNDGQVRSISRPAEALFGLDSDEVAGTPFARLFAIESQRAARDYLNGLSDNGVASVLNDGREVIGREAQGRFIPLFMTIGRLPNQSGYCAVVRDITQWKRAEEDLTQARSQAERASSQKTGFLARVSHEIRTPLNAIIGFSELMMDEKFGPIGNDRYRDYLRDINRSGNHVLDLVNDLLDISKIEAGEQEMEYEAVSLNDALAEAVAMMQPQANRDRVIIRSSFASRLPDVVADLRSVRQIALNLMSNAIRFTQAGGQVIVSTSYEPTGDIVMRIRDTGVGMNSAEIDQALKPFKQVNALKRQRGDGTGLGLPLTKAMVEANRARFAISSTPSVGTLVEITFPSTRVLAE